MESELRDWYLSTLGVVQYRLRSVSPAAFSEVPVGEQVQTQDLEIASKSERQASGISQSLRDSLAPTKARGQNQAENEEQGAATMVPASVSVIESISEQVEAQQLDDAVAFRLACWRPSNDLLVIDSWPLGQNSDNRLSQLLANILKSIQRKPDTMMQPEFIDWPVGGDSRLPAAQEHLAMFIQGRYEQRAFKWLLAMGDDIGRCLLNSRESDSEEFKGENTRLVLDCGAEAIFTHSLSKMLEEPACKKDVWAAIRSLCL